MALGGGARGQAGTHLFGECFGTLIFPTVLTERVEDLLQGGGKEVSTFEPLMLGRALWCRNKLLLVTLHMASLRVGGHLAAWGCDKQGARLHLGANGLPSAPWCWNSSKRVSTARQRMSISILGGRSRAP